MGGWRGERGEGRPKTLDGWGGGVGEVEKGKGEGRGERGEGRESGKGWRIFSCFFATGVT